MASERKLVTVLFADVIGSTALSERLDPERLRSVLDDYFAAMAGVIETWGGTVEKFVGDAIVAVFGVPSVREDDAQRALHSSLEMLDRLAQLNQAFETRHHLTLNIRVGVNTGEVIAPIGESEQRLVSGDAVNVAARLEQAAEPGSVLVGERTWLACRPAFKFGEPLSLDLKGKQGPVMARRLLGAKADAERGVTGLGSRMVGRESELAALLNLLDEVVSSGRPRLVTVLGHAGVGKSRLTREFVQSARTRYPGLVVLRGRCLAAGRGITYWALGEILRTACSISLDEPADIAREKLRATLVPLLAEIGLVDQAIEAVVVALAATAGIAFPDQGFERLEPQAVAQELARAWPQFTSAWVRGRSGILVLEDLHWADEAMLATIERVIGRTEGSLMAVATARPDMPETYPDFGGGSENFSQISLRPLTPSASAELLRELLSVSDLPTHLTAEILERAEGNPFFLEEIVGRLIDEGALVRTGDRWRATDAATRISVPDTIHTLLAARIDSLATGEKRTLQEAAVVGRVFWEDPLVHALPSEPVPSHLRALERKGFIVARPTSSLQDQPEYSFRHALIRDVAYASLPKARRARAHAQVAAWLEGLAGARLEEFAELVADHYASAAAGADVDLAWPDPAEREEVRRRAFESLLLAGAGARRRFAVAKALDLHEQALKLARSDPERLMALEESGDDHDSAYRGDSARAAYLEALAITRTQPALNGGRARLCWKLASMLAERPGAFARSPDPEPVDDLVNEGLAAAQDVSDRVNLLIASGESARLWSGSEPFGQGSKPDPVPVDQRIERVKQALAMAESNRLPREIRRANSALRLLYGMAGQYELQLELARRQLSSLDQLESRLDQADDLRWLAVLSMRYEGRYEEGLDLARRAFALSRDSNPHQLMHATFPVLEALYYMGRWEELQAVLAEHVHAFREDPAVECSFVRDGPAIGATVLAHRGSLADARELAKMLPDPLQDMASASAWQARLAVAMGDPVTARKICDGKAPDRRSFGPEHALAKVEALAAIADPTALAEFIGTARGQVDGNALLGPWCDVAEGMLKLNAGDQGSARSHLGNAVAGFERLGAPFEAARARLRLAETLEPPVAREALESARATFIKLGAAPLAEETDKRLSMLS